MKGRLLPPEGETLAKAAERSGRCKPEQKGCGDGQLEDEMIGGRHGSVLQGGVMRPDCVLLVINFP